MITLFSQGRDHSINVVILYHCSQC